MRTNLLLTCLAIVATLVSGTSCTENDSKELPRKKPSKELAAATEKYVNAVQEAKQDIHSIMVVQKGKVVFEKYMGIGEKNTPHILHSVSKTFTATAVGMLYDQGLLSLDDKVIDYFPEYLPENVNDNLKALQIRHLLTMNSGFEKSPDNVIKKNYDNWTRGFFEQEFKREPGTIFCYNSLSTHMLSAIVQKITGEKVADYLKPRLFEPLGITDFKWEESPEGVTNGGSGLYLKTEDLAKFGQFLLQKGRWNGKQIVSEEWVTMSSSKQVESVPAGRNTDELEEIRAAGFRPDWTAGYGFQMWLSRYNAFRAAGSRGQNIIVIPDKNAVVVMTAEVKDMHEQIILVWEHLLPAL